jgi:hypothetical protein
MKTKTYAISNFRNLCPSTLDGLFKRVIEVCGTSKDQALYTGTFGFTTEEQRQEVNLRKLTQAGTGNALYNPTFVKELVEWVLINRTNKTYKQSKVYIDRLIKVATDSQFIV